MTALRAASYDLRPGKFSTLSAPITFEDDTTTRSTVCIGPNTIIETAIGGSGSDTLIGNSADNILKGASVPTRSPVATGATSSSVALERTR